MNDEVKDYDKLRYSQKDVYAIAAKLIAAVIALALIYGRFLNVESNQKNLLNTVELLEEKVNENNAKMYRHVAEKEKEMEGRLDRKTARNEANILENKMQVKRNTERIIVLETTD